MPEYGDEVADKTFLRDDFERKIGRRKIAGIDGDAVAENINFASLRGRESQFFGDEEPDGEGAFGDKFGKNVVFGFYFREALERVGPCRNRRLRA